ncbi:MAG: methionine synthase [Dehalococcoidia bacterium]|nr:methionine synthase [Dehalococcoidia bacterium]
MIGSMPHTDPTEACAQVTRFLKDIPAWPQLPKRSFLENMYAQYSQGFPGAVVKDEKIYIDRAQDLDKPLEQLYAAYLGNNIDKYPISADYAAGLHRFLSMTELSPVAVKGQVTGPVSWGLTVTDSNMRAVLYDEVLADAAARLLRLKASWMERELRKICKNTIIFVDEPYMASFGSAFFSLSREKVAGLLEEVFSGITGIKGVHCCGNTDWSVLLGTSLDIVSFDTYTYAESLTLYPAEVKRLLDRKGGIAWGIVPNEEELLVKETTASLQDRLEAAIAPFTRKGIPFRQLIKQGLLTPCCGLTRLRTPEASGRALELLAELSARIRSRYG